MLFQASAPFIAAMLAWAFLHEHIPPRTWVAMSAALAGVAIMVGGSLGSSGGLIGDALCVVMASGFALVIVVTRRHREVSMTPATTLGMALAFLAMAPFSTLAGVSGGDIALLAGLGAFQIAAGLILFTAGARLIPAAQAGLITLIEVVLGPLWVWLIYSERPDAATIAGGTVIVAAVLLHAYLELRPRFAPGRTQVEPLTDADFELRPPAGPPRRCGRPCGRSRGSAARGSRAASSASYSSGRARARAGSAAPRR